MSFDLFKARPHKYVKRTGSPGSYRYWYKLPDGRIVEGDDDQQKAGRREHTIRLLIARAKGKHAMSNADIVRHTGYHKDVDGATDREKHNKAVKNLRGDIMGMKKVGKRRLAARGETPTDDNHIIAHGHDYEDHHIEESHHHDTTTEDYGRTHGEGASHAAPRTVPRSRARNRRPGESLADMERRLAEEFGIDLREPEPEAPATPAAPAMELRSSFTANGKVVEIRSFKNESGDERFTVVIDGEDQGRSYTSMTTAMRTGKRLVGAFAPATPAEAPTLRVTPEEARARAKKLQEIQRVTGPDAPAAREMAADDPTFAADEEPIRRMIKAQREGKNPYLERAKEIFERIAGHLPEKNRHSYSMFLEMADQGVHTPGVPVDEERLKTAWNSARGRGDTADPMMMTWGELKSKMGSYKGLFMEMDEILGNQPVNPEIERAKRGYARKQFERMQPFVKPEWKSANPDAPPPYPTWGDLKTWGQHGHSPEWNPVGPTGRAIPKEVFDAAPKKEDGKPLYPPLWFPIHLMPAWNFLIKRNQGKTGDKNSPMAQAAYANRTGDYGNAGKITNRGTQLAMNIDLESEFLNGLRKYIQGRGGVNQLIDIPAASMTNQGMHFEDIFKGEFVEHDLSDKTLHKVLKHKIIDPVALAPFLEAQLEETKSKSKKVKKSWSLVADLHKKEEPKVEEILVKSEAEKAEELRKSQLIKAIRAKKNKLARLGIRG